MTNICKSCQNRHPLCANGYCLGYVKAEEERQAPEGGLVGRVRVAEEAVETLEVFVE